MELPIRSPGPESARAIVDALLAHPPAVHAMDGGANPEIGLWATARDCYVFLARSVGPGDHTLETGSGLSTALFAALGAHHVCVTPAGSEVDRIVAYCDENGIDTRALTFEIGCSDEVLPRLPPDLALDLVLIDGNHGFPTPMIDWYYAAAHLRSGGLLVLDDVALPAVAHLCAFLDGDARFDIEVCTAKWRAYRRRGTGPWRQDWFEQPFYTSTPPLDVRDLAARGARKIRRALRRRS